MSRWLAIIVCVSWISLPAMAQQVSVGNGNKNVNIVSGNARVNNTTIVNKKTVKNIVYNIYYSAPLTDVDKQKLSEKIPSSAGKKNAIKSVLIIPRMQAGVDIYTALNEPSFREGLSVVRQSFLDAGYEVIAYPGKNELEHKLIAGKAISKQSQGIFLSGADVCVVLDFIKKNDGDENAVTVIMSAYSRETGDLVAEKKGTSNAFRTDDFGALLESIVPEVTDGIIAQLKSVKP